MDDRMATINVDFIDSYMNEAKTLRLRAKAAEAEVESLRAAITDMVSTYAAGRGRYGGTGIADELRAILTAGNELAR